MFRSDRARLDRRRLAVASAAVTALATVGVVGGVGGLSGASATPARSGVAISVSAASVAPGAKVTVSGRLAGQVVRRVSLQASSGQGWKRAAAPSRTSPKGAFSFSVAAPAQPGAISYRVVAPRVRVGGTTYQPLTSRLRTVMVTRPAAAAQPASPASPASLIVPAAPATAASATGPASPAAPAPAASAPATPAAGKPSAAPTTAPAAPTTSPHPLQSQETTVNGSPVSIRTGADGSPAKVYFDAWSGDFLTAALNPATGSGSHRLSLHQADGTLIECRYPYPAPFTGTGCEPGGWRLPANGRYYFQIDPAPSPFADAPPNPGGVLKVVEGLFGIGRPANPILMTVGGAAQTIHTTPTSGLSQLWFSAGADQWVRFTITDEFGTKPMRASAWVLDPNGKLVASPGWGRYGGVRLSEYTFKTQAAGSYILFLAPELGDIAPSDTWRISITPVE